LLAWLAFEQRVCHASHPEAKYDKIVIRRSVRDLHHGTQPAYVENEQTERLTPLGLLRGTTMISIIISNNHTVCSVARRLHSIVALRQTAYRSNDTDKENNRD
jgi:hypothetical protein